MLVLFSTFISSKSNHQHVNWESLCNIWDMDVISRYVAMWVFLVDVGIVRCQKCPWSLSLSFRTSLQVLSPSVLLHRMGLLTFESFLVVFFVDTFCYPCSLQHHGSYIAYVNVFCHLQEMLSSWFVYDVYCDTITGNMFPECLCHIFMSS